jgi:hypothetical protein
MKRNFIRALLFILAMTWKGYAMAQLPEVFVVQEEIFEEKEQDQVQDNGGEVGIATAKARIERAAVEVRVFDQNKLSELKKERQFDYGIRNVPRENIWIRFYRMFLEALDWMFRKLFNTSAPPGSIWVVMALVVIAAAVIAIKFLDINLRKSGFKSQGGGMMDYKVEEENIHVLDFKALIQEAINSGNYRLAIRYLYLFSLKKLADRDLIEWIPGKTNHEYEQELTGLQVASHFSKLGYYFEYAWYGDFEINPESFSRAQSVFNGLDESLEK